MPFLKTYTYKQYILTSAGCIYIFIHGNNMVEIIGKR